VMQHSIAPVILPEIIVIPTFLSLFLDFDAISEDLSLI
jgi:hypothetical protein